jgi:hypothetical protein
MLWSAQAFFSAGKIVNPMPRRMGRLSNEGRPIHNRAFAASFVRL